jgi:hypothetical protein
VRPEGSVISDTFPFRPTRVEGTENVEMFWISSVENVINPGAIIKFMTPGDEGYVQMFR